jgi:hypothetical protein
MYMNIEIDSFYQIIFPSHFYKQDLLHLSDYVLPLRYQRQQIPH